ncbi:hypothetical protein [Amycolatopsis anabasis]|uniref:hypothetical protein n=1 Tax=Amycolatopsis anabasis TaxID=1840409 RepID=UPI00131DD372|nr:hypothetical protein [Amycolatopsis anabasis]
MNPILPDPSGLLDMLGMLDSLGDAAGSAIADVANGVLEPIMRGIWDGALWILREAFKLADNFSIFTVSTTEGPVSILWPMMLWISGVLGLGLFFWQIIITTLRGGRGFTRLVGGPFQYGVALAVTVGLVGGFLASADGLTTAILDYSLHARNFNDALNMTGFTDAVSDGVKAVVLGLAGLFGVVPAGLGYVVEMLFREAAIYVLVATTPLTAAGLLANVTAIWFWRVVRWLLAAIAMKPVLALTLVLGIAIAGGAQGLSGLLAGVGVLLVSLCVPLVLFKLFAFVDPNTDAGAAFRDKLHDAGLDSYGANSIAGRAGQAAWNKAFGNKDDDEDDSAGADQEQANTDRFDQAADDGDEALESSGVGEDNEADSESGDSGAGGAKPRPEAENGDAGANAGSGDEEISPAAADSDPPDDHDGGDGGDDDPGPPEPPGGGGGTTPPDPDGGPKSGGGGGGGPSDAEIEEAAVVA